MDTNDTVGTVEAVRAVGATEVAVVKRGRGRPKGSKNKPKVAPVVAVEAPVAEVVPEATV